MGTGVFLFGNMLASYQDDVARLSNSYSNIGFLEATWGDPIGYSNM